MASIIAHPERRGGDVSAPVFGAAEPVRAAGWEDEKRPFHKWSNVEQESYHRLCSQVLRCNVARTLTGESLRDFGCRLAESGLLQWFCKLDRLEAVVRIPGKSALQRYSQMTMHRDGIDLIDKWRPRSDILP